MRSRPNSLDFKRHTPRVAYRSERAERCYMKTALFTLSRPVNGSMKYGAKFRCDNGGFIRAEKLRLSGSDRRVPARPDTRNRFRLYSILADLFFCRTRPDRTRPPEAGSRDSISLGNLSGGSRPGAGC